MASEMRKCKECGKLFMPKGREQYCSDVHYRPCPVCGTPVEAKYLSDPPKKCPNCRYSKSKIKAKEPLMKPKSLFSGIIESAAEETSNTAPAHVEGNSKNESWLDNVELFTNEVVADPSVFCEKVSGNVLFYIGNEYKNNFQKGHKYLIKVERSDYVYNVTSVEDVTTGEACDIIMPIASQISFYQKFGKVKK